jgi:2,3-bisphosphoglycerate-independent phosphoglycerate mutase
VRTVTDVAVQSPAQLVQASYDAGITDEFVEPVNTSGDYIQDGDSVVFFNFRPDRARELTRAFIDPNFHGFERPFTPKVTYVCMTEYDATFERDFDTRVAFPKSFPTNVLADYLADLGLRQLHIAETEKYAHVTFFFNGGVEEPKEGEQRVLIPSPKVATYDLQPEMSASGVTKALVEAIEADAADVYIVNYANGDMVGHTGILPATIAAIEAVDAGLKQVVDAIASKGGVALVTADHGNSEQMVDADGSAWTAHTLAPVPFVLIETGEKSVDLERQQPARLADIAPTLIDLMELPIPAEWTGRSLLVKKS